ncbi:flagellar basal body-associated FliL family protein [uncultured Algimonas sp.]|uniref:flagellar basal body-associated FliL family protein n=1 Tax=uncultured Algimonas sp. TaxID=1547920 RepID=UPI0026383B4A|nr:flagellar basal body-associated FliL family protein [uncultured Algimonas sp.]
MKAIILPVVMAVSAAGGVFAADMIRGDGGHSAPSADHAKADGHDTDGHDTKDKGHAKADHAGKGHDDASEYKSGGKMDFIKFKRQFVVPVVKQGEIDALVLLNLGLEVPDDKREAMFRMEPRFRDAFIRELLQLSDDGYFDEALTSPGTYEVLRETLTRAAQDISEDGVSGVLILDLSRQDN